MKLLNGWSTEITIILIKTTRVKCYNNVITIYKNSQEPIRLVVTQLQVNLVHILNEKSKHKYIDYGIHQNN